MEQDKKDIILKLAEPLPSEAIQHVSREVSKKGYDATGIGYQYAVNRFNEVLGTDWGFDWEVLKEEVGNFGSGKPFFDITVSVAIWILDKNNYRKCVGGHIASIYSDALKGAITNAFKKTAAFWGVGRQAYEGSLDIDMTFEENPEETKKPAVKVEPKFGNQPKQEKATDYVIGFIESVTTKKGTSSKGVDWERTVVLLAGKYYSTFDKVIGQKAQDLEGREVKLTFRQDDKFLTILAIEDMLSFAEEEIQEDF